MIKWVFILDGGTPPSTLQPLHEHHGKIACVVNIGRNKCHIHIKGADKVYKGEFGLYVKYIA